ncbi:MAG: TetR/AcrR family transcriptional regulator [Actinobacteria bacterium]|nr:TetR/AcrR family transcriptional regulator [Actinomycetota bacterium]
MAETVPGGRSADPLFDTLFRGTAPVPLAASAAPVRVGGTRSRAGNAMSRTRDALMAGAARAVEANGTKISMSQVAACAGVAKATLYNHFRTRDAVLGALLDHEVERFVAEFAGQSPEEALTGAAVAIAQHPLVRALARVEPATLSAVARVELRTAAWRSALVAVRENLAGAGLGGERIVLRWLASFLLTPADPRAVAEDVGILLAGLPPCTATADARSA